MHLSIHGENGEESSLLGRVRPFVSERTELLPCRRLGVGIAVTAACALLGVHAVNQVYHGHTAPSRAAWPSRAILLASTSDERPWWPPASPPWMAKVISNNTDGLDLCIEADDWVAGSFLSLGQCSKIRRGQWFFERTEGIAWLAHPELCLHSTGDAVRLERCDGTQEPNVRWDSALQRFSLSTGDFPLWAEPRTGYHSLFQAKLNISSSGAALNFDRFSSDVHAEGHHTVVIHYEALCPNCREFMSQQVPFLVGRLANRNITWKFVPYGLAHRAEDQSVHCQHGPLECDANRLSSCAIHLAGDGKQAAPFLYCLETQLLREGTIVEHAGKRCAALMGKYAWWPPLQACFHGELGDELVAEAGAAARATRLDSVPLVLVNGEKISAPWRLLEEIGLIKPDSPTPSFAKNEKAPCSEESPC
eukprot:TRINITY_DN8973_c0_g1_i1.p1 TRINITY_DN8973_c0_g1~~TRINITY_DN8973_c0_g1_i1.p1  ORF type:complete len:420 (+),score=55.15 TRINITY_DN8973_c0_g1_i1:38-1297(+)